jgi:hypothetical protein
VDFFSLVCSFAVQELIPETTPVAAAMAERLIKSLLLNVHIKSLMSRIFYGVAEGNILICGWCFTIGCRIKNYSQNFRGRLFTHRNS